MRLVILMIIALLPQTLWAQTAVYTNRLAIGIAIDADDSTALARIATLGGNLEQPNLFDLTPLMQAAGDGSVKCAQFLIGHGVQVDATNREGFSAAYYAVYLGLSDPSRHDPTYRAGRAQVLQLLISAGSDVSRRFWHARGFTLAHIAALTDNIQCMKVLAAAKVDMNATANFGETPLMIAAQNDHLDVVRYLVANGASLDAETVAGRNVLDYGANWPDVTTYLRSAGARSGSYATLLQQAFGSSAP